MPGVLASHELSVVYPPLGWPRRKHWFCHSMAPSGAASLYAARRHRRGQDSRTGKAYRPGLRKEYRQNPANGRRQVTARFAWRFRVCVVILKLARRAGVGMTVCAWRPTSVRPLITDQ